LVFVEARKIGSIQEVTHISGDEGGIDPAFFCFPPFLRIQAQKIDPVPVKSPYGHTH
jgi:hypothetical protein